MRRREFLGALTSAVASRVAHAQQADGMRRIGIIVPADSTDMKFQIQVQAFEQELKKFGWMVGQNIQIETRWATANDNEIRRNAAELAALKPEVILAHGSSTVGPMQQVTRTIPIVFPVSGDPVAAGFVESLSRPGGNITGFALFEYSIGAKWVELLKQIAPRLTRAAVLQQAGLPGALGQVGAIQSTGPTLGVEIKPLNVRDAASIEAGVTSFAQGANGGMIVVAGALPQRHAGHDGGRRSGWHGCGAELARPGGNITGLSSTSPDLEGKRLELLKEILPDLSYVGILRNPSNPFHVTSMK